MSDLADKFDKLFDSIPDLQTEEEIDQFLIEAGYNPAELSKRGTWVANTLIENKKLCQIVIDTNAKYNDVCVKLIRQEAVVQVMQYLADKENWEIDQTWMGGEGHYQLLGHDAPWKLAKDALADAGEVS